jgi:cation diffusion facilitator CzcD-associated flavoprotein CzcO
MTESSDVVVIGAGPAGLAAGACLRRAGMNFIIFEKEVAVGSSWRRHYDRLRLHTVKRYSSLPYLPFPRDYPRYVPRALMVKYLEAYADHFGLSPRFGEVVCTARREGAAWFIESTSCAVRAPFVIVASGYNAEPVVPAIPGLEKFEGSVLHSAEYRNARPFANRSVLVIGMGNTGAEIALDLAENGADPTISLRGGVHIVPRELFGIPIQIVAMFATRMLPLGINDVVFPYILDFALGDLEKFGIKRPQQGLLQQIRSTAKIPVIDIGTARKIIEGAIKIAPAMTEIVDDGVCFCDGKKRRFDAIILATGYRPNYASFLSASGIEPTAVEARNSGLYFVGFHNWVTGLFREIGKEAVGTVGDIARHLQKDRA